MGSRSPVGRLDGVSSVQVYSRQRPGGPVFPLCRFTPGQRAGGPRSVRFRSRMPGIRPADPDGGSPYILTGGGRYGIGWKKRPKERGVTGFAATRARSRVTATAGVAPALAAGGGQRARPGWSRPVRRRPGPAGGQNDEPHHARAIYAASAFGTDQAARESAPQACEREVINE